MLLAALLPEESLESAVLALIPTDGRPVCRALLLLLRDNVGNEAANGR